MLGGAAISITKGNLAKIVSAGYATKAYTLNISSGSSSSVTINFPDIFGVSVSVSGVGTIICDVILTSNVSMSKSYSNGTYGVSITVDTDNSKVTFRSVGLTSAALIVTVYTFS